MIYEKFMLNLFFFLTEIAISVIMFHITTIIFISFFFFFLLLNTEFHDFTMSQTSAHIHRMEIKFAA